MRDIVCIALYSHCVLLLFSFSLDQCRVLVRFACVRRVKRYMIRTPSTGHVALVTLHDTRLLPVALLLRWQEKRIRADGEDLCRESALCERGRGELRSLDGVPPGSPCVLSFGRGAVTSLKHESPRRRELGGLEHIIGRVQPSCECTLNKGAAQCSLWRSSVW